MTPSPPLPCPICGYDLSATQLPAGECPECGGAFEKSTLDARRHAAVSLALSFIAFGTLAGVLATGIGNSYVYLPRPNEGSGGSSEAAPLLSFLPFVAVAYGVASLASLTGKRPLERRWPMVVACVFALCTVVHLSATSLWGYADYPRWLQPPIYATIAEWTLVFTQGAMVAAGALTIRRVATHLGSSSLRRLAIFVVGAGGAKLILDLMTRLHALYSLQYANFGSPFGNSTAPQPLFVQTPLFTDSLQFLYAIAWWIAWPALGFLALHVRALWKAR